MRASDPNRLKKSSSGPNMIDGRKIVASGTVASTAASIGGFAASSLVQSLGWGGLVTVGASAPILGLLGAMVAYGRRTGSGVVGRTAWSYALYMIVFGFLMRRVDNAAHIGGFAAGFLAGN